MNKEPKIQTQGSVGHTHQTSPRENMLGANHQVILILHKDE